MLRNAIFLLLTVLRDHCLLSIDRNFVGSTHRFFLCLTINPSATFIILLADRFTATFVLVLVYERCRCRLDKLFSA